MKPLYNSNKGRTARPRTRVRRLGQMSKELRAEALKYGITRMDVGLTLLGIGVDVLILNR